MIEVNQAVSRHLLLLSQLKSLDGANSFSINSYASAGKTIGELLEPITIEAALALPGIGKKISSIIGEVLSSGESSELNELQSRYPVEMMSLTQVPGVGPKKALKLYGMGYHNFEQLCFAAEKGELKDDKLSAKVLLARLKQSGRFPYQTVAPIAKHFQTVLSEAAGVQMVETGGSFRRQMESCKDLDIIAIVEKEEDRSKVMETFKSYSPLSYEGKDIKSSIQFPVSSGQVIQIDLWIGTPDYYGSLLSHITGSKNHNIKVRTLAKEKGWQISEYGIFDSSNKKIGGKDERDLFKLLDIPWIEPKDRNGIIPEGKYKDE